MKILHVLNTGKLSGAENVAIGIISMFKGEQNIEMAYCSLDGSIRDSLTKDDIDFYPLINMKVTELRGVIKKYKPDVIHAHDMKASFIASRCCGDAKLICHIHNSEFDSRRITPKAIAFLFASRKASHIFWVSKSAMNSFALSALVRKKSSVLYNILDTHKLYERVNADKNAYDYDIVFLGRLSSPKDPLRLVEVFARVAKNPEIKMCIIGDGPMRQEVEEELHNRYLDKQVTLLGFLSNPYKVLKSAKVMVMTSKNEGTPMCALEAMALGVPIVSTPVDGLLDIIKNDVNGYLCTSDDEIAKKLEMIVMNKELHERLYENQLKLSKDWNDTSAYKRKLLEEYMLASRR